MTISERIFYRLDKSGHSQKELADFTGIKPNTISDWKIKGTNPSADKIARICDFLGVSAEWLLLGEGDEFAPDAPGIPQKVAARPAPPHKASIPPASAPPLGKSSGYPLAEMAMPVYDQSASAGLGNYFEEAHYELLAFNAAQVPPKADFGIRISGDSMEPLLSDGDIVWVDPRHELENGQIGIFYYRNQSYCKKLRLDYDARTISLISFNPKYAPIVITDPDELRTVGRVLLMQ